MGTPVFQGRSCSGGLFWVFFWAVAKEYLACGARPAKPNKTPTINIARPLVKLISDKPESRNEFLLLQKTSAENTPFQTVALNKSPSIISPLKAVAMAAAFAFYAINLPILNKFS